MNNKLDTSKSPVLSQRMAEALHRAISLHYSVTDVKSVILKGLDGSEVVVKIKPGVLDEPGEVQTFINGFISGYLSMCRAVGDANSDWEDWADAIACLSYKEALVAFRDFIRGGRREIIKTKAFTAWAVRNADALLQWNEELDGPNIDVASRAVARFTDNIPNKEVKP